MDYFYQYYNDCDHHSTFSPLIADQCYCPSSTFLLSLNIILLAILIYTFTMEKITITINPKSPFIALSENVSPLSPTIGSSLSSPGSISMGKGDIDLPSGSLELLRLPSKSSSESSKVMMKPQISTFNCFPSPSDSLFGQQNDEKLINLESTNIFNEPLSSPTDSFESSASTRRKLIKPDFSLSFFDSSISSTSIPTDDDSRMSKVREDEDDSFKDFNVLIHSGQEEDYFCR